VTNEEDAVGRKTRQVVKTATSAGPVGNTLMLVLTMGSVTTVVPTEVPMAVGVVAVTTTVVGLAFRAVIAVRVELSVDTESVGTLVALAVPLAAPKVTVRHVVYIPSTTNPPVELGIEVAVTDSDSDTVVAVTLVAATVVAVTVVPSTVVAVAVVTWTVVGVSVLTSTTAALA